MYDPLLTPAHDELRHRIRDVRDRAMVPFIERRGWSQPLSADELKAILKMTAPLGYPGGVVSKEDGGAGLDYLSLGVLIEELAPVLGFVAAHVVPRQIAMLGSPAQKQRYLPALLAVDHLSTTAMTEPGVGSDAGAIAMIARRAGDRYLLDGVKTWLTIGTLAEVATVLVSTDPARGGRGLSRLIVELDHARLAGTTFTTLGDRLVSFAEVRFDGYEVPVDNRLGEEGEGLRTTLRAIQASRASMASHVVGIAQAAVDAACAYAKERGCSPTGWTMLDRREDCAREASIAKCYATEAAVRITSKAIQVHGAYGVSDRYPVERLFRDARMLTFPDETSEMHRLLVGRAALGLDAFR